MLKFLLSLLIQPRQTDPQALALQWMRDPLSHPALQAMNQRELADLPFRR